jgi:hypothetical protein
MSISYSVECTNCDYTTSLHKRRSKHILCVNGELKEHLGSEMEYFYCTHCDGIYLFIMGKPYKGWKLNGLEKDLMKIKEKLKNSKLNLIVSIFRLIALYNINRKIVKEKKRTKFNESEIFWEEMNLMPRCFNCRNQDNNVYKKINDKLDFSSYIHKCGGNLILGLRSHGRSSQIDVIHYDVEGNILKKYTSN